jgi:hypothetical protein
LNITFINS